jgi:NADH dehydrogenase [ubiquinone] 1 alpha subcomplex assembly factor 5
VTIVQSAACCRRQEMHWLRGCNRVQRWRLVRGAPASHKKPVAPLFDMQLRADRRDRAARTGPELFLLERAFADCLERIEIIGGKFDRALLIGCPDRSWRLRLLKLAPVEAADPGPLFAGASDASVIVEDRWVPMEDRYDLVVAVGTLDTVNDLPGALRAIATALRPGGLLIGAVSGGDTLPRLRAAVRAADALSGTAVPHVHPRIEAAALSGLLGASGFVRPVIDVDRVHVSYMTLDALVADLRAMAATNILSARPRPFTRLQLDAARRTFADFAESDRVTETFELLHFAAWVNG